MMRDKVFLVGCGVGALCAFCAVLIVAVAQTTDDPLQKQQVAASSCPPRHLPPGMNAVLRCNEKTGKWEDDWDEIKRQMAREDKAAEDFNNTGNCDAYTHACQRLKYGTER